MKNWSRIPVVFASNDLICWMADSLSLCMQGTRIKAHEASGGQFYSAWRALLAGVIGLVITLGILFLFFSISDATV